MFYLSSLPTPIILLLVWILARFIVRFLGWCIEPILQSFTDQPALSYEHTYQPNNQSVSQSEAQPFPKLLSANSAKLHLSVIIPAYNEVDRLPSMLKSTYEHLSNRTVNQSLYQSGKQSNSQLMFELIVVDDGSSDQTTKVANDFARSITQSNKQSSIQINGEVRVLTLSKNQGKGGAVQQGMLHARGEYLLMADADGATDIRDLEKLEVALQKIITKDGHGIAVGSRAHLAEAAAAERAWYRNILTKGFHVLVSNLGGVHSIKDTQCGFKLFTRETAKRIFAVQHLRRWCFDVEVLYIAQTLNIPVAEVGVRWTEVPGSKLNLIESSAMMARDLCIIRFAYATGLWKMTMPNVTGLPNVEELSQKASKESSKQK